MRRTARPIAPHVFEAKDDFDVAKVKLHYAVDGTEGGPHKTTDLDLGGALPKTVTRRFDWRVGAIVRSVGYL